MAFAPSGQQYRISSGDHQATVVEVGGGIREYTVAGLAVIDSYPVDAMCDGAHGAPLIPWPNRLRDGAYDFEGQTHQLAITEPSTATAIHGLLRWRPWRALVHEPDRVVMGTVLHPMQGYPFSLDVHIDYHLGEDGLVVTTTVGNVGDRSAPFGYGQHPYLSAGGGRLDECTLVLDAATRILTDERQLPSGREPVEGTGFDLRGEGRRIGDLKIDCPFTDLARDGGGRAWVRLRRPDGRTVGMWADGSYPYIELYTGDTLSPERRRVGLGAEPMTCPPDAFRSGEGLVVLEAGGTFRGVWGLSIA